MARRPDILPLGDLKTHIRTFCAEAFGEDQADEAARILNLYCKYSGRTTAEMMDSRTYDLPSGEFRQVCDDFVRLEAEALRQFTISCHRGGHGWRVCQVAADPMHEPLATARVLGVGPLNERH